MLTAVQHLVPAHMRATAPATFLLINNLVGLGLGSAMIGKPPDVLTPSYGAEALRYAMVVGLGAYFIAVLLMAIARRYVEQGWVEE